jgi:Ca2+-binding EF-hand superfamily protein
MATVGNREKNKAETPKVDGFSQEQIEEFREAFNLFDQNGGLFHYFKKGQSMLFFF